MHLILKFLQLLYVRESRKIDLIAMSCLYGRVGWIRIGKICIEMNRGGAFFVQRREKALVIPKEQLASPSQCTVVFAF